MSGSSRTKRCSFWPIDVAGAVMGVVFSLGAFSFFVQPMIQARDHRTAGQAELQAQRAKLDESAATVVGLKRDLESIEKAVDVNPVALRSAQYSNQRLAELTNLASTNGLSVDAVKTHPAQATPRFEIIPIHLSGSGSFRTCTAFLHDIRQQFPDTGISVIELADNPNDPSEKTRFHFMLTWYAAPATQALVN